MKETEKGRECWWKVVSHRNYDSSHAISVTHMHVHVKLFVDWCSSCSMIIYVLVLHNKTMTKRIWIIISLVYVCVCERQSRWVNTGGGSLCGLDGFNWSLCWRRQTHFHPPSAICGVTDTRWFQQSNALTCLSLFLHSSPFLTHFYKSAVQHWTVD